MALYNMPNLAKNKADESWKAQAFINISLPAPTQSGVRKLGAIGLKIDKVGMAELIEFLNADPKNVEALMRTATFDFQLASTDVGATGFSLPTADAAESELPVADIAENSLPF